MKKRLLLAAGTILQLRYRIVRQLGSGGMGAVYEAIDERISKTVAVKETFANDDDLYKAFEREAKLLAKIEHNAFPRVTDYFADGDSYYIVMDLIRGEDFSEILSNRSDPFEPKQVCIWANEVLNALEILHAQNIIHRDIKPSNLKLTPDGNIKLLDFGIAKGATSDTSIKSISSMAAATLQFAPLEQVLRASTDWYFALSVNHTDKANEILQKGTDMRSDLYALGATLYEMLTKHLPENAPTRALALWSGQTDKLIPIHKLNPQIPNELSAIVQKAMELEPENRTESARKMREDLEKIFVKLQNKQIEETVILNNQLPATQQYPHQSNQAIPLISESEQTFITEKRTLLRQQPKKPNHNLEDSQPNHYEESNYTKIEKNEIKADHPQIFNWTQNRLTIPKIIFATIILGLMTWGILSLVSYIQDRQNQPVSDSNISNANTNIIETNENQLFPLTDEIKIEFKTKSLPVSVSYKVDGKGGTKLVTADSPLNLKAKQSMSFKYAKTLASEVQVFLNSQEINLPLEPANPRQIPIEIEINKDNFRQILQTKQFTFGTIRK